MPWKLQCVSVCHTVGYEKFYFMWKSHDSLPLVILILTLVYFLFYSGGDGAWRILSMSLCYSPNPEFRILWKLPEIITKVFYSPSPGQLSLTWSYFSLQRLPKLSPPFQWTLLKSYRKTRNVCVCVWAQGYCALWTLLCEPSSGFTFWGNRGVCPQRTGSWLITSEESCFTVASDRPHE